MSFGLLIMPLNPPGRRQSAIAFAALLIAGACTSAGNDKPLAPTRAATAPSLAAASSTPVGIVISQVYGGGGNSGATLKNDFVELYNGTVADIPLAGWSVQYASSAGTSWQVTSLSGTLQAGHYYLVQEAQGSAGSVSLPTPDALGTIAMAAGSGKVALVNSTAALSGSCPTAVVDFVGFGSSANCFEGSGPTPTLTNTTAAIRKDGGRQDTDQNGADFATGAPAPRNTSTTPLPPLNTLQVSIAPAASSAFVGATVNFAATTTLGGVPVATSSAAWTSSNTAVATIDASTGVASTLTIGTTNIGVTITTTDGKTVSTTTTLTVTGAAKTVTVTPTSWNLKSGQSKTFVAAATDADGNPVATSYVWSSSDPSVATVDAATGSATGRSVGTATITATAPNGVAGAALLNVTAGNVSVSTRTDTLPVGFQTQLFVNSGSTDSKGAPVGNGDVIWSSSNPAIVSADPNTGIITANGAGSALIKATAKSDGIASGSTTIIAGNEAVSPNARVGHNTELGVPADADPSNDIIVARRQYTLSYNPEHGGPNWVSWNLDATHKGSASRCNCMTADTALTRLGIHAFDTNDWINGGVWSRGHMSPSADWADTPGDNAATFFLSNMIPQNQTANAGAWGSLENYLRTLATGTTEIYIVAGPIFTKNRSGAGVDGFGYMNSLGHIAVPDSMWKVAIVVPDARDASTISNPSDVRVIAVNMPNEVSATGDWSGYTTTIDRIQRSTGYDLLSALPADVQCRIEVRNCVPVARLTGSGLAGGDEGETLSFSAATSSDADATDVLSYQWTVAGQPAGSDPTLSYTFADNGSYAVRVVVADDKGAADTASAVIAVANVAPTVSTFDGATILQGETYSAAGSFTDPGADSWRASVNYGDGSGTAGLALAGNAFALEHEYTSAGSFTVTVNVLDKDGAMGSGTAQVTVQSPAQGIANLSSMVGSLGATPGAAAAKGGLNAGQVNSLQVKLNAASSQLAGNGSAATNTLEAFINEMDALVRSGRLGDATAAPIVAYARRVIASIGG